MQRIIICTDKEIDDLKRDIVNSIHTFSKGGRQDRNEIVVSADLTEHYNSMVSKYACGVYTELGYLGIEYLEEWE